VCRHGPLGEHGGNDIICLDAVSYSYGATAALEDVTMHIEAGCNLGIIGPNGGGKTTLLKIILGLLDGYGGTVSVAGLDPRQVCRRGDVVGYVAQRPQFEQRFPVSVRQVVRMGLAGKTGPLRPHRREDRQHVEHLLAELDLTDLAGRAIGDLSGGQQQRAFIARALAAKPRILLLDEPLVGIDVAGQRQFAHLIHRLHDTLGLTIVVVSHDLRAVAGSCGKVAVLSRRIHYHDSPDGLTSELLAEIFRHDIAPALR
jgi:zinc transport system ATP-binding protein